MNVEANASLPRSRQSTSGSSGETIYPICLDIKKYQNLKFSEFVDKMYQDIGSLNDRRFKYYNSLREVSKANKIRLWLTRLAVTAALLTGVAAVLRLLNIPGLSEWDIWAFAAALLAYAVMGALSLYERSTDQASAYFRHLGVTLAIRDGRVVRLVEIGTARNPERHGGRVQAARSRSVGERSRVGQPSTRRRVI